MGGGFMDGGHCHVEIDMDKQTFPKHPICLSKFSLRQ